ncbi:thioredoxin reductase (NADPH) [Actinopolyspora biskrensis]|uniref:Thioredoxin reductase (NADPH) n=1 Tax=Actinopolyspora biskrensis TaxID=1470178 RepID=A0A852YVV5_9ACTN|nr:NAD(P)/FAD-dependent oxidoreductase [Actinopolyspora biskrensis]NYH78180.1 thioredoxin reductase (NADPH) [Actinopolyspora biskrensis]
MLATGREEFLGYGGELLTELVDGVERGAVHGFVVRLAGGKELTTRSVLVATGLRDEPPRITGVREQWGEAVLHCPYCHGYEFRDSPLAVLGGDNRPFTLHQAQLVRQWSSDVVFLPNRIALTEDEHERLTARGVRVVEGEVARVLTHEDGVSGVELADGRVLSRSAVFVGPRFVPHDELLTALGCDLGENGWVATDTTGRTSVDGVWAAGNVVDDPAQLINAAGAGSTAAVAIDHYLLVEDVEQALAGHRASEGAFSRP